MKKLILLIALSSTCLFAEECDYQSQQGQDKWVIEEVFDFKRDGFFVEAGAADGIFYSNTYVLEKNYNWSGICIEPNPVFFQNLLNNRNCLCLQTCLDYQVHEVVFLLGEGLQRMLRGGIIDEDTDLPPNKERTRTISQGGKYVKMETNLLESVLDESNAPKVIDYLSLDIEGAEHRVMLDSLLEKYTFLTMSIERPSPGLNERLRRYGYVFVRNLSHDTLYVHYSHPNFEKIKKQPFKQIPWTLSQK